MNSVLAGLRRCGSARCVVGVFTVVALVSVLAVGIETSVPDGWIRAIIDMQEETLVAMRSFVEAADSPDIDAETRSEMLANPHAWVEQNFEITIEGAILWTVDINVTPPEDGQAWLFESYYLGDDPMMQEAVVFSGPNLCLFIQTSQGGDGTPGLGAAAITQRFLEVISGRSEEEWNGLLKIVQEMNRGSEEEQSFFKAQTRAALINFNQRLSGANTRLQVVAIAPGIEYGAVHFGEIPEGMVMTPQGLTLVGDSVLLVYNALFSPMTCRAPVAGAGGARRAVMP